MSEPGPMDKDQLSSNQRSHFLTEEEVERSIARLLDERAAQIQFSSELREQITHHLPARSQKNVSRRGLVPALSLACALVLLIGLVIGIVRLLQSPSPVAPLTRVFTPTKVLPVPTQLARSGQFLSLDPTGQHLVYGLADQTGVMYTTDLASPVADNHLAMEDARDVSWSPDGSELVTTIYPAITTGPLLALVPTDAYMHLLGKQALAASWMPTSSDAITYLTQTQGQATLWQISPDGQNVHKLAAFLLPFLVQHIKWSPDGRYLAILAAGDATPSAANIQGSSRTLFLFDKQSGSLSELLAPGNFTLDSLTWAPNGRILSYEKSVGGSAHVLVSLDVTTRQTLFTVSLQHRLFGMSWSPDSRTLIYSDGGALRTYLLGGEIITLPRISGLAEYPFWLDSQHILYLNLSGNSGQLTQLASRNG